MSRPRLRRAFDRSPGRPTRPSRILADQRAFTLSELLIVTAIVGLVMAGLMSLLVSGQRSYMRGSNQVEAQQAVRVIVSRMAQEIREAGYNPTQATTIAAFNAVSATGFTIQNDWNANGTIDTGITVTDPIRGQARGEQIIYAVSGGNLTRRETGIDASPVTVLTGVQSMSFSFRDASDNVTATAASVRSVVITTMAGEQSGTDALEHARVGMQVRVRVRNQ
jgi:prepilin-type N-terminal cleavage/methylation domain-containing protein